MKVLGVVISLVALELVACAEIQYEVPEPLFEVFSPKGLRVSIADSKDIQSVEFYITVPRVVETLTQEIKNPDGGYWIFWNSDVALHLNEKIHYKVMVKRMNLFWKREGVHVVPKVVFLEKRLNDTDCSENQKQMKIIAKFPKLEENSDKQVGSIQSGKTSTIKSAYSMYKSSDIKPVTKSKTSTTSGTFFLKPSGVMEATGYKSGSSFDSTKNEGEQWEHYQSELTAEELENMRHMYGSGFRGFPEITDKLFPGAAAKVYTKSYMSSESKSVPGELHGFNFGENSGTQQRFHQFHKTHESSSVTHSKPAFQLHDSFSSGRSDTAVSSEVTDKTFTLNSANKLPNPLPPHGTMFRATEYVREEHLVPETKESEVYVEKETKTGAAVPQKIVQLSHNEEFSSQNHHIIKPVLPLTSSISGRSNELEFSAGKLKTVESVQDYRSRTYLGNIFSSYRSPKPKAPEECELIPDVDYSPSGNLQKVEKFAHELSCLASLAEISLAEEIALLKRKNLELLKKFEGLENEVKRLTTNCKCY